ncbi:Syntaxin-binding protein 4 [Biomphalaria glabrata]|nr:syntaxin-binding protein 4; partial [Biomphalaria glabrata]
MSLTLTEEQSMKTKSNDTSLDSKENVEEDVREAELIIFDNTTEGLGLKICGGCSDNGQEVYGIFIKRVLPHGLAESTGEVFDGDLILEVNGQSMQGVTYERAVSMLRQASASNHVELVITRDADARLEFTEYLTKFAPIPSPFMTGDHSNGSAIIETGAEIKLGSSLKDVHYQQDNSSFEQHITIFADNNGNVSPTSSCADEIVNHMGEPISSSLLFSRPVSTASRGKELITDSLDSLLSKKLAQDPGLKLHIDQLESALTNLGLQLTPSNLTLLRQHLNIDITGMVRFEEFVEAAKIVFQNDFGALKARLTPQIPSENTQVIKVSEDYASIVRERDQLREEIASLKEELLSRSQSGQNAEEQLLLIRKQAQSSIEEVRSLKSKLHLAEQAQAKAQQTERDYEEVVAMLENEVGQLRLQMSKSDGVNMQKRLAVLVCQLKKAESGKKTYEVATEKLMRFVEHSLETLAAVDNSSRTANDGNNAKLNKKRALLTLSNEGRDVIKTVRSLMETIPLPFGWEEAYTAEGVKYYINHLNQTTTWTHPVSCMEHQTTSKSPALSTNDGKQVAPPAPPPPAQSSQINKPSEVAKGTKQGNAKRVSPPAVNLEHTGAPQAVS